MSPLRFKIATLGTVVVVRSLREPDDTWVSDLMANLNAAHVAQQRRQLHLVVLVGEGLPVPSPGGRRALNVLVSQVGAICRTATVVFEGEGVKAMMQRTLLSVVIRLTRSHEALFTVAKTIDEAMVRIAGELRQPAQNLIGWVKSTEVMQAR